jgi:hypothetical protein
LCSARRKKLFLDYVNDTWRNAENKTQLFEYDCVIYRKITDSSDNDKLQTGLNRLGEWAVENKTEISPDKIKQ